MTEYEMFIKRGKKNPEGPYIHDYGSLDEVRKASAHAVLMYRKHGTRAYVSIYNAKGAPLGVVAADRQGNPRWIPTSDVDIWGYSTVSSYKSIDPETGELTNPSKFNVRKG